MLHQALVLIAIACASLPSVAQAQDGPIVSGRVRHVSVGPDRSIWLTTGSGNVYRTESIDSTWTAGLQLNPGKNYASLSSHFDRILFFSKDTAIMFGWVYVSPDVHDANCVYRTVDGGRHWSTVPFGSKDEWVRHGQILGAGTACISASNGRIFRTTDYGVTWVRLPRIFEREREAYYRHPDLFSFHYQNDSVAIATNRSNHLAVTTSDFKESTRMQTPLDQELFEKTYEPYYLNGTGRLYVNNFEIDKVRIFGDHYVILQNGRMYHTKRDDIAWKTCPEEVLHFEVDPASGRLYAVTANKRVGEMDQEFAFTSWGEVGSAAKPIDMRVLEDRVYLLVPDLVDVVGKDVVREQVAGMTVTEKNVKRVSGYHVFEVTRNGTRHTSVQAQ